MSRVWYLKQIIEEKAVGKPIDWWACERCRRWGLRYKCYKFWIDSIDDLPLGLKVEEIDKLLDTVVITCQRCQGWHHESTKMEAAIVEQMHAKFPGFIGFCDGFECKP